MLTSSTNLAFCYIIVAFVALVVYIDIKFLLILGSVAILINVVKVISMAVSGRLSAEMITETEINGILVTEKVTGLKEYADRMQEIMGLISNVADQTGLLALNASIEAARAGEATARSEETLEACTRNMESIEEVTAIMENLKTEAGKLQKEGN